MNDTLVLSLIDQAIDSPVKLHLLLIFHENPRLEATAAAVADRICRDIWSVMEAMRELAADGVLTIAATANGEPVYRYLPSPEKLEPIQRLIATYDDPIARDGLQRHIRDVAAYAPYRRTQAWVA